MRRTEKVKGQRSTTNVDRERPEVFDDLTATREVPARDAKGDWCELDRSPVSLGDFLAASERPATEEVARVIAGAVEHGGRTTMGEMKRAFHSVSVCLSEDQLQPERVRSVDRGSHGRWEKGR